MCKHLALLFLVAYFGFPNTQGIIKGPPGGPSGGGSPIGGGPILGGSPINNPPQSGPASPPKSGKEVDKKPPFKKAAGCDFNDNACLNEIEKQTLFDPNAPDCDAELDECCPGDESTNCTAVQNDGGEIQPPVFENPPSASRRRRSADLQLTLRHRRGAPDPPTSPQKPVDWWRCDFTSMDCCRTCRRTVPLLDGWYDPIYDVDVWPVQCIKNHGVQLVDQIACLPQYCGNHKGCRTEWTYATYLVTTVVPDEHPWGHCNMDFLPTFFSHPKVYTHCMCDTNAPYKPRRRGGRRRGRN